MGLLAVELAALDHLKSLQIYNGSQVSIVALWATCLFFFSIFFYFSITREDRGFKSPSPTFLIVQHMQCCFKVLKLQSYECFFLELLSFADWTLKIFIQNISIFL